MTEDLRPGDLALLRGNFLLAQQRSNVDRLCQLLDLFPPRPLHVFRVLDPADVFVGDELLAVRQAVDLLRRLLALLELGFEEVEGLLSFLILRLELLVLVLRGGVLLDLVDLDVENLAVLRLGSAVMAPRGRLLLLLRSRGLVGVRNVRIVLVLIVLVRKIEGLLYGRVCLRREVE